MKHVLEDLLACPHCHKNLIKAENEYACPVCLKRYPVRAGIPCFIEGESSWRLIDPKRRKELIELCRLKSWRQVIHSYLNQQNIIEWIEGEKRFPLQILSGFGRNINVLDAGCGWGKTAFQLSRFYDRIYCIDVEADGLDFIRIRALEERLENIVPIQAGVLQIPFPDNSFDLVLLNGVLEWVGTCRQDVSATALQEQALKEIARVTKADGVLFVGIENRYGLQYFAGYTEEHAGLKFISVLPRWLGKFYHRVAKGKDYRALTHSRRELRRMLNQAGFSKSRWLALFPNYGFFRIACSIDTHQALLFLITRLRLKPARITRRLAQGFLNSISLFPNLLSLLTFFSPAWGVFASKHKQPVLRLPIPALNQHGRSENSQWVVNLNPHRALFLQLADNSSELKTKYIFPLTEEKAQQQKRRNAFVNFLQLAHPEFTPHLTGFNFTQAHFGHYCLAQGAGGEPLSLNRPKEVTQLYQICRKLSEIKINHDGFFRQIAGYDLRSKLLAQAAEFGFCLPFLEQKGIIHGDLTCANVLINREKTVLLDWECAGIGPGIINWYDFLIKNLVVVPLMLPASPFDILQRCRFLPGKDKASGLLTGLTKDLLTRSGLAWGVHSQVILVYLAYLCSENKDAITTDRQRLFQKLLPEEFLLQD